MRSTAIVLLLLIGLSGIAVGVQLSVAMRSIAATPGQGIAIGACIAGYGLVTTIAAIGLVRRRSRIAWWVAVAAIVAGLLFLLGLMIVILGEPDPILGLGVVIWAVTLACLLARSTRAAAGVGGSAGP